MKNKYIALLTLCGAFGAYANTMPAKYSACSKKITEPKSSNGFYWAGDCSAVWVMPPAKNKLIIDAMDLGPSVQECVGVEAALNKYASEMRALEKAYQPSRLNQRQIKKLEKRLIKEKDQLQKLVSGKVDLLNQKTDVKILGIPLYNELEATEEELAALDEGARGYSKLVRKISKLKKKIVKVESALKKVNVMLESLSEKEAAIQASIVNTEAQISGYKPKADDTFDQMTALMETLNSAMEDYKTKHGGTFRVKLESDHPKLVADFQKRNPGVVFKEMPTNSSVQFKVAGMKNLIEDNALGFDIPGVSSGNAEALEGYANINFGASLVGSVDISEFSACMIRIGQKKRDDSIAKFTVNILHKYDLSVKSDYSLEYNLSEIYKKIKTNTSKGGFFKTSSIRKITESVSQDGNFKVSFYSEDPRDNFDSEAKKEIKDQFIARTLEQISKARITNGSPQALALPSERENAASVASNGLKKCPHIYCQIAGYALDLGNALFGSAETSAQYLRDQNFKNTERVNEVKAYSHYETSSFVKED